MKETLQPGLTYELRFQVTDTKTVPRLFPESPEFQAMPKVFATGFMVGFIEWACLLTVNPHIDYPKEQTVGILINVDHTAATPPGFEVCARVGLIEVDGRRLVFDVSVDDGVDTIGKGTHERFIIDSEKFNQKVKRKAESIP
jgi:fluoroacetyl-CoA thioesterase